MQAKALVVEDREADVRSTYCVEVLRDTLWTSKCKTYCTAYVLSGPGLGKVGV